LAIQQPNLGADDLLFSRHGVLFGTTTDLIDAAISEVRWKSEAYRMKEAW
jgi:hypothetical protein